MLKEIEEAIVARLTEKITAPKNVRIDEAHSDFALNLPGIDVIIGGGSFSKIAQRYTVSAAVFIIVTFQNLRSVKDRRHGVYPILEAIIASLMLQNLDLAIDPLKPKRLDNITEKDEAEEGKVIFQLEFETGFIIGAISDEELFDLLSIGLNYYLKPGDEIADATDIVEFTHA